MMYTIFYGFVESFSSASSVDLKGTAMDGVFAIGARVDWLKFVDEVVEVEAEQSFLVAEQLQVSIMSV